MYVNLIVIFIVNSNFLSNFFEICTKCKACENLHLPNESGLWRRTFLIFIELPFITVKKIG
jgi:hypothetical protein